MFGKLRKSAISGILAAMVALIGISGALAASNTASVGTLSPDGRICTSDLYASAKVRADGTANSPGVRFILLQSTDGVNFQKIDQSFTDNATGYGKDFNASSSPWYFPAYFRACARNTGATGVSNVNITLRTDNNAP